MDNMSTKFYFIGLSLASNSSHTSAVCVINRNKEIVLLDKLYFTDDIKMFFEKTPYMKNSVLMVGLVPDETLLDGKWRIHSKNYKMLDGMFKVNRNNWTNRLNDRLKDLFLEINNTKCPVFRCNTTLLRQSYGLYPNYVEKTSLDCKNLQAGLKIKYGFSTLPENILPASGLEALLYALFAYDIEFKNVSYKEIANFCGLKVLNRV